MSTENETTESPEVAQLKAQIAILERRLKMVSDQRNQALGQCNDMGILLAEKDEQLKGQAHG